MNDKPYWKFNIFKVSDNEVGPHIHFGEPEIYKPDEIQRLVGTEVCYVIVDDDDPDSGCIRNYRQGMLVGFNSEFSFLTIRPVVYRGIDFLDIADGIGFERQVTQDEEIYPFLPQAGEFPVCIFLAPCPQEMIEHDRREKIGIFKKWEREGRIKRGPYGRIDFGTKNDLLLHDICTDPRIQEESVVLLARNATTPARFGESRVVPPHRWMGYPGIYIAAPPEDDE